MSKKPGEENVYVLDRTSEFLFFEMIKKRILVAGARVAVVMNYILQVRVHDELPVQPNYSCTNAILEYYGSGIKHST